MRTPLPGRRCTAGSITVCASHDTEVGCSRTNARTVSGTRATSSCHSWTSKGVPLPAMHAHVHQRDGAHDGPGEEHRRRDEGIPRRPVHGERVEQQYQASKAEPQADHLPPGRQRRGRPRHDRHHPQGERVRQDRGAAGRSCQQGDGHERGRRRDRQQAVGEDDREVATIGECQASATTHQEREDDRTHQDAQHRVGHRRDRFQADLGHRPVQAPDQDHPAQQQPRPMGADGRRPRARRRGSGQRASPGIRRGRDRCEPWRGWRLPQ